MIQSRLSELKMHAETVLIQLRNDAANSTANSSQVHQNAQMNEGRSLEQRILSAQFALERINAHMKDEGQLTTQEYEVYTITTLSQ